MIEGDGLANLGEALVEMAVSLVLVGEPVLGYLHWQASKIATGIMTVCMARSVALTSV